MALLLVAATACNGPTPDLGPDLHSSGDPAGHLKRQALAEFTIHFDEHGAQVEMAPTAAVARRPAGEIPQLQGEALRVEAPEGDTNIWTGAHSTDPQGATCVTNESWGYTVWLENTGTDTWLNPAAQLEVIFPGTTTACNSDNPGHLLPDGGDAVADWGYGDTLGPGASASVEWGFNPTGATSFKVRGLVTIGESFSCNGVPAGDDQVCSGHGACVAEDDCDCDALWSGDWCSENTWFCYGFEHSEPFVCSAHGACVAADTCDCADTWTTCEDCQYQVQVGYQCFGILSHEPEVCSGHGVCTAEDDCQCCTGWDGEQCENIAEGP